MQSPGPARAVADGTLVEPADVDDMEGMFQSQLPGLDAGEARRRPAEHGWDLQAAIKGAAREDASHATFGREPLLRDAAPRASEPEREGLAEVAEGGQQTVGGDAGAVGAKTKRSWWSCACGCRRGGTRGR
jgi:hypothetical protein